MRQSGLRGNSKLTINSTRANAPAKSSAMLAPQSLGREVLFVRRNDDNLGADNLI